MTTLTPDLDLVTSIDYTLFISKDDPTRLNWNIATELDHLIAATVTLFKLCSQVDRIQVQDITKEEYNGELCLVGYYDCPVAVLEGVTFPTITPNRINYTEGRLKILMSEKSVFPLEKEMLLLPGIITFVKLEDKLIGIHTPITVDLFLSAIQKEDIYIHPLNYRSVKGVDTIVSYLVNYHTRRVQRGFYSPLDSMDRHTFLHSDNKFHTPKTEQSYYEKPNIGNKNIGKSVVDLPLFDHPEPFSVKLYASKCEMKEGNLTVPLCLSIIPDSEYTIMLKTDIRVLDLNFIWSVQHKERNAPFPDKGYYSLSKYDTTYLEYSTHTPGILVAVTGTISGDSLFLE